MNALATPVVSSPFVENEAWHRVCAIDDIAPSTGACALVSGRQIALLRGASGEEVYAIENFDPFSGAFVLSRGIVGDRGGVPKVVSPIFKQSFDLRSGQCLDDPAVKVPVFPVRVIDRSVWILVAEEPSPARP